MILQILTDVTQARELYDKQLFDGLIGPAVMLVITRATLYTFDVRRTCTSGRTETAGALLYGANDLSGCEEFSSVPVSNGTFPGPACHYVTYLSITNVTAGSSSAASSKALIWAFMLRKEDITLPETLFDPIRDAYNATLGNASRYVVTCDVAYPPVTLTINGSHQLTIDYWNMVYRLNGVCYLRATTYLLPDVDDGCGMYYIATTSNQSSTSGWSTTTSCAVLCCAVLKVFVSSRGIVHRDLAARNILLAEGLVAKVGDFGLARNASDNVYPNRTFGRLPVKRMAPESLKFGSFTTKSDVWSFGLLLSEIFSSGVEPFADVEPERMLVAIENDMRPSKPERCPDEVHSIAQNCWALDPERRPTFHKLRDVLACLLEKTVAHDGYLSFGMQAELITDESLALELLTNHK
ncbi:Proto-oncogene tyrosine-protein kinase FER [Aphelenchoides avenae]|nr:Proto-oncogene tyrosine-protein kinase FER [Aphelenchus avenae]